MPTLAAPAGAAPSLLTLLTPIAANPVAPVDGAAPVSFADIVSNLTAPAELPPLPLPTGQALPVERPKVAGRAPDALPEIDQVMVGCGWRPEMPIDQPTLGEPPLPITGKPIVGPEPELPGAPEARFPVRDVIRLPIRSAPVATAPHIVVGQAVSPKDALTHTLSPAVEDENGAGEERPPINEAGATRALPELPGIAPTPATPPVAMVLVELPVSTSPALIPARAVESAEQAIVSVPHHDSSLAPAARSESPLLALSPAFDRGRQAQPDSQRQPDSQPQPQPKPIAAPVPPAELRIAPDLARHVAQMIQPALERISEPPSASPVPVEALATSAHAAPAPQPVAAPAPPSTAPVFQSAPVDLGRAGWAEAMIDRIAEMPQVDRREAQIKLLPDMLGKVEVTLVERDERVHVTLNVETPQARQLLSEAAPRLQELAEARGLRLGQTEIGGGTSQDRRPAQDQNQPQTPLRPRSAQPEQADDQSNPDGDLIA